MNKLCNIDDILYSIFSLSIYSKLEMGLETMLSPTRNVHWKLNHSAVVTRDVEAEAEAGSGSGGSG